MRGLFLKPNAKFTFVVLSGILLFAFFYGIYWEALGLHIGFLRAESGLYLNAAFAPMDTQLEFISDNMLKSYGGHFTPVVFLLEFLQSKVYGTNEWAWYLRQMFVTGMLGTSCAWLIYEVTLRSGLRPVEAVFTGVCFSIFFLWQPRMLELLTWPFMAFQLLTLTIVAIAAGVVVVFSYTSRASFMCAFVMLSYVSMWIFGVGVSSAISSIFTGSVVLLLIRDEGLVKRGGVVKLMALATSLVVLHVLLMVQPPPPKPIEGGGASLLWRI